MQAVSLRKRKKHMDLVGYVMIAPYYAILLFFLISPVIQVIYDSFTNYNLFSAKTFIGLKNYRELLQDSVFLLSVKNTAIYTAGTLIPVLAIGLLFALILNSHIVNTSFARTCIFIPHVVSMVAMSMVWMWLYEPAFGLFNKCLELAGMTQQKWLFDPKMAMVSVIIMSIWKSAGYNMIVFLAGIKAIPANYYEASTIDGANRYQKFINITLPMLAPATFFLVVTGLIGSFNVFEQVNVMTAGGPANMTTTIVHQIYIRAFNEFKMGYASAQAVILLSIVTIITVMNFKYGNKDLDLG